MFRTKENIKRLYALNKIQDKINGASLEYAKGLDTEIHQLQKNIADLREEIAVIKASLRFSDHAHGKASN